MQFYYAEEPASPLDFDNDDDRHQRDALCAMESAARAKSMAPAISRAGAFREPSHSLARSLHFSASRFDNFGVSSAVQNVDLSMHFCGAVHGG